AVSTGQQAATSTRSGLTGSTIYYWRIVSRDNRSGATTGPVWRFTTLSGTAPTVTTASITGITSTSAAGGGNVTSEGSSPVTARGVCWRTSQNPTTADSKTVDGSGPGSFTSSMTGLSPSTPYYVRAYATNSAGTNYGSQVSFTTASPPGSPCPGTPTVSWGGKTYNTVLIGTQCWFRENLDFGTMVSGSQNQTNNGTIEKYCYKDSIANCATYGGLYQWDEAMQYDTTQGVRGICPPGWHIPTLAEFQTLSATLGGDGNALKAIGQGTGAGAGTNTSGFSALLAGHRSYDRYFRSLGSYGYFWSSTQYGATGARNLSLGDYDPGIYLGNVDKAYGFSVRCLED
ncbi:MAG: FISUMP domain-containing protein, partial [Bacteroidota bacterium]